MVCAHITVSCQQQTSVGLEVLYGKTISLVITPAWIQAGDSELEGPVSHYVSLKQPYVLIKC